MFANAGDNVTLLCPRQDGGGAVVWIWGAGAAVGAAGRFRPQSDGDLAILALEKEDSKVYLCQDAESNESIHTVLLQVRSHSGIHGARAHGALLLAGALGAAGGD